MQLAATLAASLLLPAERGLPRPNGKAEPHDIVVKQFLATPPGRLPPTLPVHDRADVDLDNPGPSITQYKPWIVRVPTTGELLLTYRDDMLKDSAPGGGLAIRRSSAAAAGAPGSWGPPEYHPELGADPGAPFPSGPKHKPGPDGEFAIHALHDGTVLLNDGSCSMWRSTDAARSFHNVSAVGSDEIFHFNSTDECGSWSVLELTEPSHGLPAGVYYFADQTIWRSEDGGRHWAAFSTARNAGETEPIHNFPSACGADNRKAFFFQSEVYRRRDGTFLHGTREPPRSLAYGLHSSQDASDIVVDRHPGRSLWRLVRFLAAVEEHGHAGAGVGVREHGGGRLLQPGVAQEPQRQGRLLHPRRRQGLPHLRRQVRQHELGKGSLPQAGQHVHALPPPPRQPAAAHLDEAAREPARGGVRR